MFKIAPEARILDLGGGTGAHIRSILPDHVHITVADIADEDLAAARARYGFETVKLSESDSLPFRDNEFEFCFCSSVIEHTTGPKNVVYSIRGTKEFEDFAWQHQKAIAKEIERVAKRYFVQTPYRYFVIESHTWLPAIIVFLPRSWQMHVINIANKFWPKQTAPDWNLLNRAQMQSLFPEATIVDEKVLFLTKSLIAVKT